MKKVQQAESQANRAAQAQIREQYRAEKANEKAVKAEKMAKMLTVKHNILSKMKGTMMDPGALDSDIDE